MTLDYVMFLPLPPFSNAYIRVTSTVSIVSVKWFWNVDSHHVFEVLDNFPFKLVFSGEDDAGEFMKIYFQLKQLVAFEMLDLVRPPVFDQFPKLLVVAGITGCENLAHRIDEFRILT